MQVTTDHTTDFKAKLSNAFTSLQQNGSSEALTHLRQTAFERFEALGFPTTKHEEWKYTNLRSLLGQDFEWNLKSHIKEQELTHTGIKLDDAYRLVFVNGIFDSALSTLPTSEEITVLPLAEAFLQKKEVVAPYFAAFANYREETFTALNTAFAQHGVFIQVANNKLIDKPVLLYFISDAKSAKVASQPRNLFVLGKNSSVKIVEDFLTFGEHATFTNAVTEIIVQENASLEHYKIQNESPQAYQINTTQVYQLRDSRTTSVTVSLNGALVRNNLNIVLDAENCEANMYGLYVLNGKTLVDNHTLVDHAKPNSYSNELYKGILDGKSTGVFNGKIFVRQDAQKTNAFQSNRNIILSPEASMNTKPQLEIFADDVKCSHGATTGQLDEDMLFYLRARGIGLDAARALLMYAFAGDVLNHIPLSPVKEYIEKIITNRFTM
jgi:Fe-S cluster assembly protein SufD